MEVAVQLRNLAQGKLGAEQYCWKVERFQFFLTSISD